MCTPCKVAPAGTAMTQGEPIADRASPDFQSKSEDGAEIPDFGNESVDEDTGIAMVLLEDQVAGERTDQTGKLPDFRCIVVYSGTGAPLGPELPDSCCVPVPCSCCRAVVRNSHAADTK